MLGLVSLTWHWRGHRSCVDQGRAGNNDGRRDTVVLEFNQGRLSQRLKALVRPPCPSDAIWKLDIPVGELLDGDRTTSTDEAKKERSKEKRT